ncbi:hypothetical protein D3C76_1680720 [compost metagenome]
MQQQGEGRALMLPAQARPHHVALGPLAVQIADLLAVAGDIGQTRITSEVD